MSEKTKLILICDTKNEIDDQFAIAYALASPEIELLGVVSTQNTLKNGANSVDIYHEEAEKIIKLAGSKVPCFKGAHHPLVSEKEPERSEGVDFIIKTILDYQPQTTRWADAVWRLCRNEPCPLGGANHRLTIACTGPATDIVNACILEPRICEIASFIWLGGHRSFLAKKYFNRKETNFKADILAAETLPELDIDLTVIPVFPVSSSLLINTAKLEKKLKEKNTPLTSYLADLIDQNQQKTQQRYKLFSLLANYWFMCDIATVAVVKKLGIKRIRDRNKKSPKQKNICAIDRQEILKDFYNSILGSDNS